MCAGSLKFDSKVVLLCECIPPLCPMCKIDKKGIVQSLAAVACMRGIGGDQISIGWLCCGTYHGNL